MAMIEDLLFIKTFRERKAETELQKSRAALVLAQAAQQQAQLSLDEYIAYAKAQEQKWFEGLYERLVKPREITAVQQDVAILRAEERVHEEDLINAKSQHDRARDHMHVSTVQMREASTARQKFVELARAHHLLIAQEAERKEEVELEEVASIRREREDWEVMDV
jgi:type III secretion protein O